jgi:hypothetical protein
MKRIFILSSVVGLALAGLAGCASDDRVSTMVAPDGPTESKTFPTADPSMTSDETIAPTDAAASPPSEPAPVPTPPSKETAEEGPGAEEPAASAPAIETLISVAPLLEPQKTMKLVRTDLIAGYSCEGCGGGGGGAHDYMCPTNYVVTGYELGAADFGCPSGSGGCADYTIVGALRVTCAKPTPVNVDPETTDWAQDYASGGNFTAGAGSFVDLRKDQCSPWPGMGSGVATGVFGRGGDRLDSFGFTCGSYMPTKTDVTIDSSSTAKETTYQWSESQFGGAPGIGGAPFSLSCPAGQALVGLRIRSGLDVDGIDAIYCGKLEPVLF